MESNHSKGASSAIIPQPEHVILQSERWALCGGIGDTDVRCAVLDEDIYGVSQDGNLVAYACCHRNEHLVEVTGQASIWNADGDRLLGTCSIEDLDQTLPKLALREARRQAKPNLTLAQRIAMAKDEEGTR